MKYSAYLRQKRRRLAALQLARGWSAPAKCTEAGSAADGAFLIEPIGLIETPFREVAGTPIQASRSEGARGRAVIQPQFRDGLKDLSGFDRVWLIYWLHKAPPARMFVVPFLDTSERGVFATRAPARPCPIGISAVRLLEIGDGGVLELADVDMLDGTPLLDIKPYVPEFDCFPESRAGWFDRSDSSRRLADERFEGSA